MLPRVFRFICLVLAVAIVAAGVSRAVVAAELADQDRFGIDVVEASLMHGDHEHVHSGDDIGTWDCLKYCVDGAPDAGLILTSASPDAGSSALANSLHAPAFSGGPPLGIATQSLWPRGPPKPAAVQAPLKRQHIFLQTARLRI